MIAVDRPASETEPAANLLEGPVQEPARRPRLLPKPARGTRPRLTRLGRRISAIGLVATLLFALGGSGVLFNSGIPVTLQARAVALHQQWAQMRADGTPELDLATLEQEWSYTQATQFLGVAATCGGDQHRPQPDPHPLLWLPRGKRDHGGHRSLAVRIRMVVRAAPTA